MRKLFFTAIFVLFCLNLSIGQVYSDKIAGKKHVALSDSIKAKPYPYILPIWGAKVTAKGFNLPYSAGLSMNYVWQQSDLVIENLAVGFNGALGTQFASLKREGLVTLSDNDFGFYGGGGAGIMIFIKENVFINGEYEIAWASNSFYKDGWISTAGGGIGFKF